MANVLPMPVKAHANAALGHGLVALLRQGPESHIQHIVERADLQGHHFLEGLEVKCRQPVESERVVHKPRQDDRAKVAATIGTAGVARRRGWWRQCLRSN